MSDELRFDLVDNEPSGAPLLTIPGGIGLYRKRTVLRLSVAAGKGLSADIRFEGCSFRLGAGDDSFLAVLVPGSPETQEFDLGFHWDDTGVSFVGGALLDVTLPVQSRTPIVQLKALHLIARPELGGNAHVPVELSVDLAGSLLGIVTAAVERLGIEADFFLSPQASPDLTALGPISAKLKLKAPSGVGLSVDLAGVVNGGGFMRIDPDRGRYDGLLTLNLLGIGVTAIAIINTKPTFSLLVVITANFKPVGLDIGFGFTINAIGGLFGLNRGADIEQLRIGVRTNAISSLMFPAHPVEDAPRILNDLDRIFPALDKQFLVGPLFELGWGKPTGMFTLAIGVVIQIPDPKIVILGVFKALVPPIDEAALLRLQVNFVGFVDFGKRLLGLDASLYDSRLIMYTLEGDMAARLRWGSNASFAVCVGGFHPRYVPASDLEIAPTKRVTINLLPTSDNPRLRVQSYYAATSNSLQHGARLEVYAAAAGFGIKGFLGYDLLAQISPFSFEADFGGAVAVIAGGEEIMSLSLGLHLSGPSPFHVDGEVSFKIIVVRVHIPVHATFGGSDAPTIPDVDVAKLFRDQFKTARNWTSTLPDQSHLLVALLPKLRTQDDEVLAHPSATLQVDQHTVPLKVKIQRVFGGKPSGADIFEMTGMSAGADPVAADTVRSEFAPAQYFDLSNDEKMSAPAFQDFDSGIVANAAALVRVGIPAPRDYTYRDHIADAIAQESPFASAFARRRLAGAAAIAGLSGSAVGQSGLFRERVNARPTGDEIAFAPAGYRVVDAGTLQPATSSALSSTVGASQAMRALIDTNPSLRGTLIVVPAHEVA